MASRVDGLPGLLCLWGALALAAGCADGGPAEVEQLAPTAVSMEIVSGSGQSGPAGQMLPEPLVVRVLDDSGDPVPRQIVNFRVVSGGGSVFAGAAYTDPSGIAKERWTLGAAGAEQRVEVRAVDPATGEPRVFATFTATSR